MTHQNLDLRVWLEQMADLGELTTVDEPVDPDEEMGAITYLLGRTPEMPAVHFTRPRHPGVGTTRYGARHLWNPIGGSWKRVALTLGLPADSAPLDVIRDLKGKLGRRIPPTVLPQDQAPVLQNSLTGDQVDLAQWPFPKHWPQDGGRYAGTYDIAMCRGYDGGPVNVGTYRMMVHGPRETGIMIASGTDTWAHMQAAWARGEPLQIAAAWGVHPLFIAVGGSNFPIEVSEYEFLGGLLGQPVATTTAPLTGLTIPAFAEFVVEGEIAPGAFREEGPFGEYTAYYSEKEERFPVVTVKAVHFRDKPVFTNALLGFPPSNEEQTFDSAMRAARIWSELDSLGAKGVTGVYCPPSAAAGWGMTVVSLKQRFPGHAKQVLTLAGNVPGGSHYTKWVILVDDDVDPSSLEEVTWAMAVRCPPAQRIMIEQGTWNNTLDPAMDPSRSRLVSSRAFIDATKDFEYGNNYRRCLISKAMYEQVAERWPELGLSGPVPPGGLFDGDDVIGP